MNCVVIDSNRDSLHASNEQTVLNIEYTAGLRTKFIITNEKGDVVYNCKLNLLKTETHKITDANGNTILKFRLDMNSRLNRFILFINSKNNNNENEEGFYKDDYMNINIHLSDEDSGTPEYRIEHFNKARGFTDVIKLFDKSNYKNKSEMIYDYKICNRKQDLNALSVCETDQSCATKMKSSITLQPGVEPLFMVVLHLCIYLLHYYKYNEKWINMYMS